MPKQKKAVELSVRQRLSVNPKMHLAIWLVLIALVFFTVFNAVYSAWPGEKKAAASRLEVELVASTSTRPARELQLHVHPRIAIEVFGVERAIPAGVGITIGNNIDNDLSGALLSPVHTHEADNVLHVEVVDEAAALPRGVLTLGYFFNKLWGQRFNSQCIFEYCVDDRHSLKMFVDGAESSEFDAHSLLEDEEVQIVFREK